MASFGHTPKVSKRESDEAGSFEREAKRSSAMRATNESEIASPDPRAASSGYSVRQNGVPNMFQQDYLMRLIWQFVEAMRRTVEKDDDPDVKAASVEDAIANALEMDANVVLGLAPESFAGILSVSGTDPHVVEYLVRGMALESYYLEQAGKQQAAQLRFDQACALAVAYGIEAPAADEIPVMNDFDEMLEADGITGEE